MSSYTIPNVVEKRPTGERSLDIYSRLLSDRIIYLGTEIDDGVANVIVAQLLHLESEDADQEINLYINSPGGSMTAMLAVYDTMQFIRARVTTTCVGQAGRRRCCSRPGCRAPAPFFLTGECCCTSRRRKDRGPCPTWSCRLARWCGSAPRWRRC